jgi:hypothetical protein
MQKARGIFKVGQIKIEGINGSQIPYKHVFWPPMIPSKETHHSFFPLISLLVLQEIQNKNIKKLKKYKNHSWFKLFFAS